MRRFSEVVIRKYRKTPIQAYALLACMIVLCIVACQRPMMQGDGEGGDKNDSQDSSLDAQRVCTNGMTGNNCNIPLTPLSAEDLEGKCIERDSENYRKFTPSYCAEDANNRKIEAEKICDRVGKIDLEKEKNDFTVAIAKGLLKGIRNKGGNTQQCSVVGNDGPQRCPPSSRVPINGNGRQQNRWGLGLAGIATGLLGGLSEHFDRQAESQRAHNKTQAALQVEVQKAKMPCYLKVLELFVAARSICMEKIPEFHDKLEKLPICEEEEDDNEDNEDDESDDDG